MEKENDSKSLGPRRVDSKPKSIPTGHVPIPSNDGIHTAGSNWLHSVNYLAKHCQSHYLNWRFHFHLWNRLSEEDQLCFAPIALYLASNLETHNLNVESLAFSGLICFSAVLILSNSYTRQTKISRICFERNYLLQVNKELSAQIKN